jgi:hypothetical protein
MIRVPKGPESAQEDTMPYERTFVTSDEVLQILSGREIIAAPSYQKQWTASRLVKMNDGTTIPLLWVLAEHKFGAFDPRTHMPYWADKRCTNESLENVEMIAISPDPRPRQNPYGVPAGTVEYMRRYNTANKERLRAQRREYYQKVRAAYLAARDAEPSSTPSTDASFAKLLDILPPMDPPKEGS